MKFNFSLILIIYLFISVTGCKKEEKRKSEIPVNPIELRKSQKNVPDNSHLVEKATPESQQRSLESHEKQKVEIVIPDKVKNHWRAVKLSVYDKESKKTETVEVKLGDEYKIQDSDIKIKVADFLPDFRMDALTITSLSNKPDNPAVNVSIYQKEKEIFSGWLFANYKTVHSFQHKKFSVVLEGGIKKKK